MGAAGVVNFGGVRIGGITGIYKEHDYTCGHHERPPYDRSSVRSAYHVRDLDVYRLLKVCSAVHPRLHRRPLRGCRTSGSTTPCRPERPAQLVNVNTGLAVDVRARNVHARNRRSLRVFE